MSAADGGSVAILAALPEESSPILRRMTDAHRLGTDAGKLWQGRLGGHEILLAETGAGSRAAGDAAAEIFDRRCPARWIGAGFAGALSPELPFGCVAIAAVSDREMARRALACDPDARETAAVPSGRIVRSAAEKARLLSTYEGEGGGRGALPAIVDMESAAWSSSAAARGIPGILVRVVSDTASEEIPDFVAQSVLPGGGIDRRRVVRHALLHPSSIGKLRDLRRRARTCGERLAGFLDRFAAGGF